VSSVTIAIDGGVSTEGSSQLGASTEVRLEGENETQLCMLEHVGSVDTGVKDIDVDTRSSRRIVGEDESRLAAEKI